MKILKKMIELIKLRIAILTIQLKIKLLKEKRTVPNLDWPRFVIIHHEAGNAGFLNVNEWHRQKWGYKSSLGYYVGYQWYLDKNKKWWQGRRDIEKGAHTIRYNENSIGVCVMGNYEREIFRKDLADELTKKVDKLRAKYNIPRENVLGHKEVNSTKCPGDLMDWVIAYRNA